MLGVFTPTPAHQARVGAPPGKVRSVAYKLCDRCFRRRGSTAKVEALIFRDLHPPERN